MPEAPRIAVGRHCSEPVNCEFFDHCNPPIPDDHILLVEIRAPALVPEMTYEGMEVTDGQAAGLAWESLLRDGLNSGERERIEQALRAYCGQDTLGMVRIIEKLQQVS
jgi:hypothetical protein